MKYAVDIEDVHAAARRIAGHAHRTPVLTSSTLNRLSGKSLFFKCENLQRGGAFKFRGAFNAVAMLSKEEARRGVVTHSSGNFAQALALAAKMHGITAHIVMPTSAPRVKRQAVEEYGARIVECEPTLESRETTAASVLAETGGTLLHPYNHRNVIAGQGTVALEFLEDVADLAAIIAPIGGGGLISGISIATAATNPDVSIFAGEPAGADDAARSKAANRLIPQTAPDTLADGLLTSLGDLTWPIVRDLVECIITVEDEEIVNAMRLVWERMKLVIEPSAAVPLAAVLSDEFHTMDKCDRVGIVLSGGNVDLGKLAW